MGKELKPWWLAPPTDAERAAIESKRPPGPRRLPPPPSEFERRGLEAFRPIKTEAPNSPAHWAHSFPPGGPPPK